MADPDLELRGGGGGGGLDLLALSGIFPSVISSFLTQKGPGPPGPSPNSATASKAIYQPVLPERNTYEKARQSICMSQVEDALAGRVVICACLFISVLPCLEQPNTLSSSASQHYILERVSQKNSCRKRTRQLYQPSIQPGEIDMNLVINEMFFIEGRTNIIESRFLGEPPKKTKIVQYE